MSRDRARDSCPRPVSRKPLKARVYGSSILVDAGRMRCALRTVGFYVSVVQSKRSAFHGLPVFRAPGS